MATPEGGYEYKALISFSLKSSTDNSIIKAEFVDDSNQAK